MYIFITIIIILIIIVDYSCLCMSSIAEERALKDLEELKKEKEMRD